MPLPPRSRHSDPNVATQHAPLRHAKSTRKSKGTRKSKAMVPKGIGSIFHSNKFCTLEFASTGVLTTLTTQNNFGATHQFFLNAINSPRATPAAVNNVQGFDQLFPIYGKYKVFGCKVQLTWTNPEVDGTFVGMRISQSGNSDGLQGEKFSTADMKKWTHVEAINKTGGAQYTYRRYMSIKRIDGLTKAQFNGDINTYSSSMSSQPTNKPFLEIGVANSLGANDRTIVYKINILYYVQLFDRLILATSTV